MKTCCFLLLWVCCAWLWPNPLCAGTTPIHIDTEQGGDIDTGTPSQWDGSFENVNGAMFWNESAWVTNDTAAHTYFTDLRTGQLLYEHLNTSISSSVTQLGTDTSIDGFTIVKSIYSYSSEPREAGSTAPLSYQYEALQYAITAPDSITIILRSRGSGNGTAQPYFDVYIEDGKGGTTALRGDPIWYQYNNTSAAAAAAITNTTDNVFGRLSTYSSSNAGKNNYWMDINGGSDMGGVTYHLVVSTLDPAAVLTANLGAPFVVEFHYEYTAGDGQIHDLIFAPALLSEAAAIFEDSFGDKAYTEAEWLQAAGRWKVSKKGEYGCGSPKSCIGTVKRTGNPSANVAQVRFKLGKAGAKGLPGLVFGYQSKKLYRLVSLSAKQLAISQKGTIGADKPGKKTSAKFKLKRRRWYTLRLATLSDGMTRAYIDDTVVAEVQFGTPSSGAFGLAASKGAAVFDDFALRHE
jgi:hypothetical protein